MFELHVTFDRVTPEFQKICKHEDIKLISIALLNKDNVEIGLQHMTSLITRRPANDWKRIKYLSSICGLKIVRTKLESSCLNNYPAKYFEAHFHAPFDMIFPKSVRKDKKSAVGYTFRAKTLDEFNRIYIDQNLHKWSNRVEKCLIDSNSEFDKGWI